MIHPRTVLKHISTTTGYGVFASEFIPAGTVTCVKHDPDIVMDPTHQLLNHPIYRPLIDKYAHTDASGKRIPGWELGKYINHSCQSSTIRTGYGFEIALRDIRAGEELTVDYGLRNINDPILCECRAETCRETITGSDVDHHYDMWDGLVKVALDALLKVPQPLIELLDTDTYHAVMRYLESGRNYRSVRVLKQVGDSDQCSQQEMPGDFDSPLENPA